jgi:dTDP-4-amino-4,6-dideoxygalactose transaminase
MVAVGVKPEDEVIIPAYTFLACPAAVVSLGAIPMVAEVDESLTLDPEDVERKITPHTKAVMPVHTAGVAADMDRLLAVARSRFSGASFKTMNRRGTFRVRGDTIEIRPGLRNYGQV